MNRAEVIAKLEAAAPDLARRFGARQLALFGSAARDELRLDSDVDVLVEFEGPASFDSYFGLKDSLESLLGLPVDLVTSNGLKPRARVHIDRDLIRVA